MGLLFSRRYLFFTSLVIIFIGVNTFLLIKEIYWAALIPTIIIMIWMIIKYTDVVILILAFMTPLSFSYELNDFGSLIVLPSEPIIIIITILFILKYLIKGDYDHKILKHPITIIIFINVFWIFITSVFSTMPVVSFKFLFSRIWFLIVFYFMGIYVFKDFNKIKWFIWLFISTLVIAIFFILYNHSLHFFTHEWANKVTWPFFKDHTVYGAVLALFIPLIVGFFVKSKDLEISNNGKLLAFIASIIVITGLILSYTRAAWLSVAVAGVFLIFLLFKVKFKFLVMLALAAVVFVFMFWTKIDMELNRNKAVSSTEFKDHMESISNITTDISNTERINRWISAVRMFNEKPVFGWGPGTYIFKYAPFQLSTRRTPISTDFGTLGNAHSEFLGPLAEQGLFGLLSFASLVIVVIFMGMRLYYMSDNNKVKAMTLLILLSLITYFAHSVLNNFLHTDKVSVPFWALIGALVALDIYHFNKSKINNNEIT